MDGRRSRSATNLSFWSEPGGIGSVTLFHQFTFFVAKKNIVSSNTRTYRHGV